MMKTPGKLSLGNCMHNIIVLVFILLFLEFKIVQNLVIL